MEDKKMTVVWVGPFAAGLMIKNNVSKEENSGFESDQNVRIPRLIEDDL